MSRTPSENVIDAARRAGLGSPCQSKRGVVLFRENVVVALGYNALPKPWICDSSDACKANCSRTAIHAEARSLLNAARSRTSVIGLDMLHVKVVAGAIVPSGGPSCLECSKQILAAGVAGMWLFHDTGWTRYGAAHFHHLTLQSKGL